MELQTILRDDKVVTYIPNTDYCGSDSFTYQIPGLKLYWSMQMSNNKRKVLFFSSM
jgi:hypothetical protein